jgi:SAM-dependent methyltransferase
VSSVVPEDAPKGQGLRFGEVAELYQRRRPDYPEALVADLLGLVDEPHTVLEVGAGTGKATLALAAAGATVTAVEPDPAMAAVLRRQVAGLDAVSVLEGPFEASAPPGDGGFAVVAAAQSWHWVDPERGAARARRALRPGGVLATFWNTPLDGDDYGAFVRLYQERLPHLAQGMTTDEWGAEMARRRRQLAEAEGFEEPVTRTYDWEAVYRADALTELVQTYSGHRMLDPADLAAFADQVTRFVQDRGGAVTFGYRTVLYTARRTG